MPIFEYRCQDCGEDFEKLLYRDCPVDCQKCGSKNVKKKFSVFGMSGVEKPSSPSSTCSSCSSSSCSTCR
ncbi:MAG TPA: FmdB family transcriptional regulator [Nitrospiraceae bacterium]|nr:FmdB family transcriptional regulator [Nitrospiraceae bacterium]